jgi:hypothetical protein
LQSEGEPEVKRQGSAKSDSRARLRQKRTRGLPTSPRRPMEGHVYATASPGGRSGPAAAAPRDQEMPRGTRGRVTERLFASPLGVGSGQPVKRADESPRAPRSLLGRGTAWRSPTALMTTPVFLRLMVMIAACHTAAFHGEHRVVISPTGAETPALVRDFCV